MTDAATKLADQAKRHKQGRSPAYPGITLEKAIQQAGALYNSEGKYAVPVSLAFIAWGFGEKSSGGRETKAALKYFGLATMEAGKIRVSDKALRILLDEREDQTEKHALLRELALTPPIHKRLAEKFPDGLKSDATVEHFLVFDEGYNKSAAKELVAQFRATASYAGVYEPDNVSDKGHGATAGKPQEREAKPFTPLAKPLTTPPPKIGKEVPLMDGERIVFTEEAAPDQYVKLVASGEVDQFLLDALTDYVARQRRRLGLPPSAPTGNVLSPAARKIDVG